MMESCSTPSNESDSPVLELFRRSVDEGLTEEQKKWIMIGAYVVCIAGITFALGYLLSVCF